MELASHFHRYSKAWHVKSSLQILFSTLLAISGSAHASDAAPPDAGQVAPAVKLRILIDERGNAKTASVTQSSGDEAADESALASAKLRTFDPVLVDGKPTESWINITMVLAKQTVDCKAEKIAMLKETQPIVHADAKPGAIPDQDPHTVEFFIIKSLAPEASYTSADGQAIYVSEAGMNSTKDGAFGAKYFALAIDRRLAIKLGTACPAISIK